MNNALIFAPRFLKRFPMLQHFVKGYGEIILFRIRNKTAFCVTIFNIYSRITMPCRNHIGRICAVIILFDRVSIVITNHFCECDSGYLGVKRPSTYRKYEFGRLPLIISPSRTQKRFAPWRLKFFVNFVRKRAAVYSCGTQSELPRERTEKGISKVVSDGEWKPYD